MRPKIEIGKYSYGPLLSQWSLIKRIGAFCSFAAGSCVVPNHPLTYISTHDFLYQGNRAWQKECVPPISYEQLGSEAPLPLWYFPGVVPQEEPIDRERRIEIGNDVWLGHNVVITNYANIGDGVVAGAGAVITKEVPDYAVVAGVPARIIRYRYNEGQIKALKRIAWWDWDDDKIRECYNDFFLDVDKFIRKHKTW